MKTSRFDRNASRGHIRRPHFRKLNRRRRKHQDTFKDILKDYSPESLDEVETYSVNLPQHGKYWDNGYEDVG